MIRDSEAPPETTAPAPATPEAERIPADRSSRRPTRRERWPYWLPVAVLVLGLLVTGVLTWASRASYLNNEKRLLRLRVREAGSVLSEALPTLQTPLASAAELADATRGDATKFRQFMVTYVGAPPAHPFVSASLWRSGAIGRGPLTSVGVPPLLGTASPKAAAFFARAVRMRKLSVIGMLSGARPRLGYAFTTPGASGGYLAYAEAALAPSRRSPIQKNSAFSDLDYALYLGARSVPETSWRPARPACRFVARGPSGRFRSATARSGW